ncbi:MAG: hypothetical protein A2X48_20395 [Lentisphaerae bacterium GWF2_49_21]|nr:MAG: hypothetical protein A2X48_20395 [Lentisphaerae bacterium GWF2_49_21]
MSSKIIADNFSRGADLYDESARCQGHAAKTLAGMIFKDCPALPRNARILELGCGTGFLTERMFNMYPSASFTVTDISRKMIERCKAKTDGIGAGNKDFMICDFDLKIPRDKFDLVVSSTAFQWSSDLSRLASGIKERLRPGGKLFFSILAEPTFHELKETFKALDISYPGPRLMTESEIRKAFCIFKARTFSGETWCETYKSTSAFLRHINSIGAGNPTEKRIGTGNLRRIIAAHNSKSGHGHDIEAVYRIEYGMLGKQW